MKRKILYLSFIPYVLVFSYCLLNFIIDGEFFSYFYDIYEKIFISPWLFVLLLIVGYQVWYFIFEYNPNKVNKSNWNSFIRKAIPILKKGLFGISLIIWVLYLFGAIISMFIGFEVCFIGCDINSGFDAFVEFLFYFVLLFGIVIPILPISLMYIIMYLIKKRKSGKK